MNVLLHIKRPARIDGLHPLIDVISACAKKQGLSEKRVNEISIAAEEVLMNIFNYAYKEQEGDVEIICKIEGGNSFVVEIIDTGKPFNPLNISDPDTTQGIEERQIGGLGILLIKRLTDDFRYRREDNKNIQKLVLRITDKD